MFTQIWSGQNQPPALPSARVITIPDSATPTITADYERFRLASESESFAYADFDIEPGPGFFEYFQSIMSQTVKPRKVRARTTRRVLMPRPGFVYFAFYNGCPEACLFAHVGRPDFFKALLDYKAKKNIPDCYSWTFKVLRHFTNSVIQIPDSIFIHRHDTMNRLTQQLKEAPSGTEAKNSTIKS